MALLFAFVVAGPSYAQDSWQGDWDTSYGQVRLLQDGSRVWGDYAERGTLEAVSSPDGASLRGVFRYTSGKWGTVEFRRNGDAFEGHWRWSAPTVPGDKGWSGQKASDATSELKYASATGARHWPEDIDPAGALLGAFLSHDGAVPDFASEGGQNGPWHGGYALDLGTRDIEFQISLDQIEDGASGFADLYMAVLSPEFACPDGMHPDFCQELKDLAAGVTVSVQSLGVQYQGKEIARLAIAFGPGAQPRLLELTKSANGIEARLVHPSRGLEAVAQARQVPHICNEMQCMADRLADLVAAPDTAGLGLFADAGFMAQFAQRPQPSGDATAFAGLWRVFDETGEPLGQIRLDRTAEGFDVQGAVDVHPFTAPPAEQRFTLQSQSDAALDIAWQLVADGSGEQVSGRLLMDAPGANPTFTKGSLFVEDAFFIIDLVRQEATEADLEDIVDADTPGFGIYRFIYALRDIPEGKSLTLRAGPDRAAASVGALRADARDILLLGCTPEPDNIEFDSANQEEKLRILSSRWCKAQSGGVQGYMPGIYLVPLPQ
ncbi:MAG: hypothetical protein AB8B82_07265 [Roseovarius sp.]